MPLKASTVRERSSAVASTGHSRHAGAIGPPPVLPAIAFVLLTLGSVFGTTLATGGAHFPSPYDPASTLRVYVSAHHSALAVAALLQFASAIPLAVFTAAAVARLHHLGVRAAGATIAQVGGVLAAGSLLLSAACQWALAQPGSLDSLPVARALQNVTFLTGGPGYVASFGLLLAGICITSAFAKLLPRWVVALGLTLAVIAELATLTLVVSSLAVLLPVVRFGGLIWLIAAGSLLPRQRAARTSPAPADTAATTS